MANAKKLEIETALNGIDIKIQYAEENLDSKEPILEDISRVKNETSTLIDKITKGNQEGKSLKVELDKLLEETGIEHDTLYISNLIKCNLPQNRKPKMREIEACSIYLDEELEIIQPEFIIPLGFYATRYILEKYKADPPSAKIDYRPLYGKLAYASGQKIYPLPHPASLLYNPDYYPQTLEKYKKLHTFQKTCKWHNCCPMKRFYELGKLEKKWIELYCKGDWQTCVRYQMEEQNQYHPDNMLPDGSIARTLE
jgi:DNA polymerase